MEIKFEDYEQLIKNYAYVAYKKTKKPSHLTAEDFIQEGYVAFIWAKKRYKPSSKATFKTYLIMTLRCHFETIFAKSYRTVTYVPVESETTDLLMEFNQPSSIRPIQVAGILESVKTLTAKELEYVLVSLKTPKTVQKSFVKSMKSKRTVIRKVLNLGRNEECSIRKSLKMKLMTV